MPGREGISLVVDRMVVQLVERLYLSYYYRSYRRGLGHTVHVGVVGGSI